MAVYGADTLDDADDGDRRRGAHPLIATAIAAVMLLGLIGFRPDLDSGVVERLLYIGTRATGAALVLWALCWVVTLRRAGWGWQLGSFAILWTVAAAILAGTYLDATVAETRDLAWVGGITPGADGMPLQPDEPPAGPISRRIAKELSAIQVDRRMLENDLAGLNVLGDAGQVEAYPFRVKDCGWVLEAKGKAVAFFAKMEGHQKAMRGALESYHGITAIRERALASFDRGAAVGTLGQVKAIRLSQIDHLHAECLILGRRNWQPNGNVFSFTSDADFNQYRTHSAALEALAQQEQALMAAEQRRIKALRQQMADGKPPA